MFRLPGFKKSDNSNAVPPGKTEEPLILSDTHQPTVIPKQVANHVSASISHGQTQRISITDGHSQSTPVTNSQTRSTSVSDNQTQSMSFRNQGTEQTKTSMTSMEMIGEEDSGDCDPIVGDDGDIYSEDGSVDSHRRFYTETLQNELLQDVRDECFTDVGVLTRRLKEFAIMLGNQGDRIEFNRMMFIAHKHGRYDATFWSLIPYASR